MAKYKDIAKNIKSRIAHGEFKENEKLPTEKFLMEEYNVSKNTIRNAINILVNSGDLIPIHGSGIYVRKKKYSSVINLSNTRGFASEHPGTSLSREILDFEIIKADNDLALSLNTEIGKKLYYIKRLMIIDNKPIAVEYTYYNTDYVAYLNEDIAKISIFDFLINNLHLQIGFSEKYISTNKLSNQDAKLLNLDDNDFGLIVEDSTYLSNGNQFNYSKIWYNYKYIHLFNSDR
ncbi:GntR family transcriptional regulator [Erysipelatoclostridium sp. An15]|uniref:GntR family transcriptional regulator n=1 Tax=Erysipelatoclostridium sp. An15 TaxID=1965566 RepID=UPI000B39C59B|nr:GntR family transcriptional regulator [Erysipelatoclostridium sp. An15]OUQ08202.1 GntR family transcriptional regulator [Erysipelatoclostridium sp. An15]